MARWQFKTEANEGWIFDSQVEFRFVFHANGVMVNYPGVGTLISINEGRQNTWHAANVRVATFTVEGGDSLGVDIMAEAMEVAKDSVLAGDQREPYGCSGVVSIKIGCGSGTTSIDDDIHDLEVVCRRKTDSNKEVYTFEFDFRVNRVL